MTIGILVIHLRLPNSDSLKAKRQVIHSLKARLKNKFNISIAEIGFLSSFKESEIGISHISNNGRHIESKFAHIIKLIESNKNIDIIDYYTERI
jgi:uncharacterized protein YlxP (DUF503 family)